MGRIGVAVGGSAIGVSALAVLLGAVGWTGLAVGAGALLGVWLFGRS